MRANTVKLFTLSPAAEEALDFTEDLAWFEARFEEVGFTRASTYSWRWGDHECAIKAELERSPDGHFVKVYVTAPDEHAWRVEELAETLAAHVLERGR
jgi:hypothetical protein